MNEEQTNGNKGKLLIMDDTPASLDLLLKLLTGQGYTIHPTPARELALRTVQPATSDLILFMPGMDDFQVCQALNADEWLKQEMVERQQAQETIRQNQDHLEELVEARTADLQVVRTLLKEEIARRQRAEEALRASAACYGPLYDDTPSMYFTVDSAGTVLSVNQFGAAYLGYTPEELIGQPVLQVFVADDQAAALAQVATCLAQPGRVFHWELRKVRKDGSQLWVKETARAVRDPEGKPVVLIVCEDITERKRLEAQLHQSQKMEAVGRLAGGIAHDFNNLLTAMLGYAGLALETLPPNHPVRSDIEGIEKAVRHAADLTRQLLAFARRQVIEPKVFNLNDLVLNLGKLLRRLIGEDIELVVRLAPELGQVKADPGQIEQVLVNLAVNARDAMPHGGKLTIETIQVTLDQAYTQQHEEVVPGHYVMLAVSDTGIGMTEEVKAHLFEPFFTTKAAGQGTGLGLATCFGIVKQSDGHICVYSEPGQGTTIKVYLPRVQEAGQSVVEPMKPDQMPGGTETVLLAEDQETVRDLAARMLRQQGYTVLEATNGEEALRLAQAQVGRDIHLLLSDVVMPKMGGRTLAKKLKAIYPQLSVLFMSGYTDHTIIHRGLLEPNTAFLQKPFTHEVLACQVRELLDRGATA